MGAECVGEFTVYKKGRLATLHRNRVKNLILFSYLPSPKRIDQFTVISALLSTPNICIFLSDISL
jgi:hypothetical protein